MQSDDKMSRQDILIAFLAELTLVCYGRVIFLVFGGFACRMMSLIPPLWNIVKMNLHAG